MFRLVTWIPIATAASLAGALISSSSALTITRLTETHTKKLAKATELANISMRYNSPEMGRAIMILDSFRKSLATSPNESGVQLLQQISEKHQQIKSEAEKCALESRPSESMKRSYEIEMARRTFIQHFQEVKELFPEEQEPLLLGGKTKPSKSFQSAVGPLCGKVFLLFTVAGPMDMHRQEPLEERQRHNEFQLVDYYCTQCRRLLELRKDDHTVKELVAERIKRIEEVQQFKAETDMEGLFSIKTEPVV